MIALGFMRSPTPPDDEPQVDFGTFLESYPPGTTRWVVNAFKGGADDTPVLRLMCRSDSCDGERIFRTTHPVHGAGGDSEEVRLCLSYVCKSCELEKKAYFLLTPPNWTGKRVIRVTKVAEWPPFASWVPSRLLKFAGPDREFFLKGKRCEANGFGIAAFGYYRRVVERQKSRLLDQIEVVAIKAGADESKVALIREAKNEIQFAKAIDMVKPALPTNLYIKGHNPLTLLHAALSRSLHNESDEECLEIAHDIREVLTALVLRIEEALADQRELDAALSRLLNQSTRTS